MLAAACGQVPSRAYSLLGVCQGASMLIKAGISAAIRPALAWRSLEMTRQGILEQDVRLFGERRLLVWYLSRGGIDIAGVKG